MSSDAGILQPTSDIPAVRAKREPAGRGSFRTLRTDGYAVYTTIYMVAYTAEYTAVYTVVYTTYGDSIKLSRTVCTYDYGRIIRP